MDHYRIVCERLCALESWKYEDKSRLLQIIVGWINVFESAMPTQLEENMRYLRELLTKDIVTIPMLPVETILEVIQSDKIPSEAWSDCLIAALSSQSDKNYQISLDFTPVNIPTTDMVIQFPSSGHRYQWNNQNNSNNDISRIHDLLSFEPLVMEPNATIFPAPIEEPLDEYQNILHENLNELFELKWNSSSIQSLKKVFTTPQISRKISSLKTALLVVETIVTNHISLSSHIERIVKTIETHPVHKWMDELNKIIDEQDKTKSISVLVQELARENPSLNVKDLENQYREVMYYYQTETSRWTSTDVQQRQYDQNKFYTIAVIIRAAHLYKQYRPRDIQILSLLLLIDRKHPSQGRLGQIRTGEGKSIIVSMLAVYLSLPPLKKQVDIITTSEILARRDAEEFAPFYQMFQLYVGHNCYDPSEKSNYNADIIYGTVTHFAGDLLRTEFYLQTEVRNGRPYEAAIVDEVDSMFIDQRQHYTQLASLTPGYKSLNVILRFVFSFFQKFNITEENEFVIRQADGYYKVDALAFISEKLRNAGLVCFPRYRTDYIKTKLPKWIRGARRALYELTLNVDYVISTDRRIVVVDYVNTGVSHLNMHWRDGVHQFLELKHNLRITPERMCDSFFSNVTLFKRYRPHLYGVTGTLGGKDAQDFIQSVYEIDAIIIPKYVDSVFDIYPSQFGRNRAEWLEKISIDCQTLTTRDRRAVLVICQTIREAEDVKLSLHSHHLHPKTYLRSDLSEHIKPEEVHIGDIIVSTNLAGRGTDLKTMTALNTQGGLHVIVTFMPRNLRIEQQAFGRAGRQGQPGSARLIVCNEHFDLSSVQAIDEIGIIDILKQIRDKREKSEMTNSVIEVRRVEAKDRLLVRFLGLAHSRKSDLPFTNDIFKPGFSSLRELWASFYDEDEFTAEKRFESFAENIQQRLNTSISLLNHSLPSEDERINRQFEAVRQLITHPKYLIHAGFDAMCKNELKDVKACALGLYQRALQLDEQDFTAHYNTIPCYINNDQTSINEAIGILEKTLGLLEKEIETRRCIEIFHDPPTSNDGNTKTDGPIDQTSLAELIYLQIVQSNFQNSLENLKQFNVKKHEISCRFEHWKESLDCLKGNKFEPLTNDINAEREEWLNEGLMWRYVFVIETKRCWWKTVFVYIMGVAQIVGGAYLCLTGHLRLGTSMILDGALDVYRAVATKITDDFDLATYFKSKVIKYGKDLLCINGPLRNALEPVISLKGINLIGVAVDAVEQISANGFSVEALTQIAINGMNIAGVDQKTIDLVKQLPERIKDAQALLSGDVNQMLERGAAAGLPLDAVRQIVTHGFTVETITQLTVGGMAKMGVDQNTIDLIQQLPERIKDAQALLSGDVEKILDRAVAAGLPVNAVRQIIRDGFTFETATQLALDGMTKAGVDQKIINLVKQLPDRIDDAQAILSGDINRIIERGILAGLLLNTIQQITTQGFSLETITQLARDGINVAGMNQEAFDLLNQLSERIQDAQALLSGDVNQILDRGLAAGLPVNAIRDIIEKGFSPETATQLAVEGMTYAGVDANKIDLINLLPERIKDAQALLSGDFDRILERGMSAGLPVNTIRQIVTHGLTVETATQLAIEGMTIAGIDDKTINSVKALPERIKDAQALVTGDVDQILKRGMLAGVPVEAIRQIATQRASVKAIAQIALTGMEIAGVDQNTIDFVKQLPEKIKVTQAALNNDLEQLLKRGIPASINHVLCLFNENSLFNGKEKEMFNLVRRYIPIMYQVIDGKSKTILSDALNTISEHINHLPLAEILPIVFQTAFQRVTHSEQTTIHDLLERTVEQLESISGGLDQQACQVINNILQSSSKWATFENTKHQLNNRIRQLINPVIERERQFQNDLERAKNNSQAIKDCCQTLADLKITIGTVSKRRADLQRIIDKVENSGGSLLKRAINDFFNEISQHQEGTKSPVMMELLKEYINETVIRSAAEKKYEEQIDKNDAILVDNFIKAITYIQKQKQQNRP